MGEPLCFWKLQGAGNDFILIWEPEGREREWGELALKMCRRRHGVGGDGLIVLLPSRKAAFKARFFNPDGSEAEVCGNGLRCIGRFLLHEGRDFRRLAIETGAGIREIENREGEIWAEVGAPSFSPSDIPADLPPSPDPPLRTSIRTSIGEIEIFCLSVGNPHAVAFVEDVRGFPLEIVGPEVENHPLFPRRINFEIACHRGRNEIEARVWERGAGETPACGTGACALAAVAFLAGKCELPARVLLPGGELRVEMREGRLWLSGPAELVFRGEWLG